MTGNFMNPARQQRRALTLAPTLNPHRGSRRDARGPLRPRRAGRAGLFDSPTGWSILVLFAWVCLAQAASPPPLSWETGQGFRSASLPRPAVGRAGFTDLPPSATGIVFTNYLSRTHAALNQILLNGSGVAAGDVDGDGWCDLFFCAIDGPCALYRNLGGWKFQDITAEAGVACAGQNSTGALLADVDGDGDLDLLVNGVGGGTRLFLNDGQGHFNESTNSGLTRLYGSMSMALADIDGDGDLDLYVANYRTTTIRSTGYEVINVNGRRMLRPEDRDHLYVTPDGFLREHGEVDMLYLNDGHGHFQPVSWTDGRFKDATGKTLDTPPRDWALSAVFRDMNGDGVPDIYVCNDFWSPDKIWINDGQGNFTELPREAMSCTSTFSMCMDFADINRDGLDDFLVLDMLSPVHARRLTQTIMFGLAPWPAGFNPIRPQVTRNTVFLNRGDGTYAEIAQLSGLEATEWSWCPIFLDVDLDGYEDLLVATGNLFDTQDQDAETRIKAKGPWPRSQVPFKLWMYPPLALPKLAFRNHGDLTFKDMSETWGFHSTGVAQGMCLADLDNDGDLDVIVNHLNGAPGIFRNESPRPLVAVRLKGQSPNTRGIGAKLTLRGGAVPTQSQEMMCGGRYLSSDENLRVFAAGTPTNDLSLQVRWRSGKQSILRQIQADRVYEVDEADATAAAMEKPAPQKTLFVDQSDRLRHTHAQEFFDDFARQPLMANKLSQSGPGVCWFDADGDGWEDLIIGGGRGSQMAVFRNDGQGGFTRVVTTALSEPLLQSQTSILGLRVGEGSPALLAGSSNYADGSSDTASVRLYDTKTGRFTDAIPGCAATTGPLALADVRGSGGLDLFVGGRVTPGRYPEPVSSRLFHYEGGQFKLDPENTQALANVGMVSGAGFSDLDGDGWPELLLACEWGPIRIFHNNHGRLSETTAQLGLDRYTGWWNGIAVGDFDNDGRMDIMAANGGRNTPVESHRAQPLRLFYGDFNNSGGIDSVEAFFDVDSGKLVPERPFESLANGLPFIRERFDTHQAYATASVREILGDTFRVAKELSATTLESMVFLNRGDHFEARPLPLEAQFAPAFGICVGDVDGDGREDIFLSQNFTAIQPLNSPCDAGRGLWLKGDGRGGFQPLAGQDTGIKIYGEQRGCALADFDHDGRVDLVVAQNSGPTRLFHNLGAKPGLRVRLTGPPGNPRAIGATMRLISGAVSGPAREIHAGSGYWSQDAAVQVLAAPVAPTALHIRWPGGACATNAITVGTREISVSWNGVNESK
jgi:enediyne biosynthesis protein E4